MKAHGIFSTIAAVAVIILTPAALKADWTYSNGTITDGTWTLKVSVGDNNTLTVTGVNTPPGSASALDLSTAVTDGGSTAYTIVSIGNNAFNGSTIISSVTLPDSVTSIGNSAFLNCTSLNQITPFMPDAITNIGIRAFEGCTSLTGDLVLTSSGLKALQGNTFRGTKITSADISGSGVTSMPNDNGYNNNGAFYECASLTNVVLPETLEFIGNYAFYQCKLLETVTPFLPGSVTNIGERIFENCTSLAGDLVLTNSGLKAIPNRAFEYCNKLNSLDASGSSVANIDDYAFYQNYALTNVFLSDTLESIGRQGFYQCKLLGAVTPFLPGSITNIGESAFESCTSLAGDLVLTNSGLKVILNRAFEYCNKLNSLDMSGSSVTNIDVYAFWQDFAMTNVILSKTLKSIGTQVFYENKALTNFYFLGNVPDSIHSESFQNIPQYITRVFVPRFNYSWEKFAETNAAIKPLTDAEINTFNSAHQGDSLPIGVWSISSTKLWFSDKPYEGTDAFYIRGEPVNAGVGEVSPDYGMITLDNDEVSNCTAPANAIYERSYWVCTGSVTEVETSDHVWETPVYDSGLSRDVTKTSGQPQRLTWLWERNGYFVDTTNYHGEGTVTLSPDSPFNNNCYANGTAVTLIANPADGWYFRRWLGDVPEADAHNATITVTVDGPKSCRPIFSHGWTYSNNTITDGNWTLKVSVSGNDLTITGVNTVTDQSVLDLSTPVIGEDGTSQYTIAAIGNNVFKSRIQLKRIFLPETLTSLGNHAFDECTELVSVEPFLPGSVTSIGSYAFQNCKSLEGSLVLTNSGLKTISNRAFQYCDKIKDADLSKSGVTSLEIQAFYSANERSSLTNVFLPETLEFIGKRVFFTNKKLKTITPFLPGSITNIGESAFESCISLIGDLVLTNSGLKALEGNIFLGAKITSADMSGSGVTSMPNDNDWNNNAAFHECSSLTNVVLPEILESIGNKAFYMCSSLRNIMLPETLKIIGSWGFYQCRLLEAVTPFLPGSVTNVGESAFESCTSLAGDLVLTNSNLKAIPSRAFEYCNKLNSVNMSGSSVANIDMYTFWQDFALTNVVLPATLERIGVEVFYENKALTNLYFEGNAPTFSDWLFKNISDYTTRIHIPKNNTSWEEFGKTAFTNVTEQEMADYKNMFPGELLPQAMWVGPNNTKQWICGWIPPGDTLRTTVLILQ